MKLNSLLYSQDKETTTTTVTHQPAVTPAPSGMSPTKTSVSFTGLNNSQSNLHQLCCLQYKWRVWGMMLCQTSSAVLNYIKKTLFKKLKGRLWKRVWSQWEKLLLHIYDMNEDVLAMEGCHIVGWHEHYKPTEAEFKDASRHSKASSCGTYSMCHSWRSWTTCATCGGSSITQCYQ